jgi:hypothetical protein
MIPLGVALAIGAVVAFAAAFGNPELRVERRGLGRSRRVLRRAKVSRIADLVDGRLACVAGAVEPDGDVLTSILSRQPCVAYEIVEWKKGVRRALVPFYVNDGSGRVRVDAAEAAILLEPSESGETFEERVVPVGARIRIVGSVRLEAAVTDAREHGFRDHARAATLTGTAKYPLLVDLDRE